MVQVRAMMPARTMVPVRPVVRSAPGLADMLELVVGSDG
jgi:hypothetical protein